MQINISKKQYKLGFLIIVGVLFIVRLIFPDVASLSIITSEETSSRFYEETGFNKRVAVNFVNPADSSTIKHPIYSVSGYDVAFPDTNKTHLMAAEKYGISVIEDSAAAALDTESQLVYIGCNPYYDVEKLTSSVPYLVPRAATLLQDIAENFMDSLLVKGMPLHKIVVSSVLRTRQNVADLQKRNRNATTNSCHMYGTTIDISYNRYNAIDTRRQTRSDSLKWVLSEVINDLRQQGRCYVKYEKRQPCFHITTR